jgi:hypothetical protein
MGCCPARLASAPSGPTQPIRVVFLFVFKFEPNENRHELNKTCIDFKQNLQWNFFKKN